MSSAADALESTFRRSRVEHTYFNCLVPFQNEAVLEKHHWRAGVAALHQTRLLEHLPEALRCKIENEMRSLILATDMTRQQEFFSTLRERIASQSLDMSTYADRHFILQVS